MPTTFRITNELTGVREDVTHYFPEETAAEFGLSTRTVVRRISSGQWHGVRIGQTVYMTDADWEHAYQVERERTRRRYGREPEQQSRPRLGLAISPDDADRVEGLA